MKIWSQFIGIGNSSADLEWECANCKDFIVMNNLIHNLEWIYRGKSGGEGGGKWI